MARGGCRCGAVRYAYVGAPGHTSVCHCGDCRRSAGAPMVAWTDVKREDFSILAGEPVAYESSEDATRSFCGRCGTGLWYVNERALPGLVAIQTCTLDDPAPVAPSLHVQDAERLGWTRTMDALPTFERYPPAG